MDQPSVHQATNVHAWPPKLKFPSTWSPPNVAVPAPKTCPKAQPVLKLLHRQCTGSDQGQCSHRTLLIPLGAWMGATASSQGELSW